MEKKAVAGHIAGYSALGIGAVALIAFLGGMTYTIDEGERGVLLRFGEFSEVTDPGLHFKMPGMDKVVKIPIRVFTLPLEKVWGYSTDQQPADISLAITFAIKPEGVKDLYAQFGTIDNMYPRIIEPAAKQEMKAVFGQYTAIRSIQNREALNQAVEEAVIEALAQYTFLDIRSVQIQNIDFSDAYEQTIEDRMKAEVEVERFKQNLEREKIEASIALTRAQAAADAGVKAAEAQAKAIALRSEAEAQSIERKGKALRDNPGIVMLMQAEKWNGQLPTTMLPDSTVPVLGLPDASAPKPPAQPAGG